MGLIKIQGRLIQAQSDLIFFLESIVNSHKRTERLQKRIKDLENDKLVLWTNPSGVSQLYQPNTVMFLRSLRIRLDYEREMMYSTYNKAGMEYLKTVPGIVW